MQVMFFGNYVFWAWNLGLNRDSHVWIPEVVHENAILNKNRLRHTVQHYKAFQSNFLCHDGTTLNHRQYYLGVDWPGPPGSGIHGVEEGLVGGGGGC